MKKQKRVLKIKTDPRIIRIRKEVWEKFGKDVTVCEGCNVTTLEEHMEKTKMKRFHIYRNYTKLKYPIRRSDWMFICWECSENGVSIEPLRNFHYEKFNWLKKGEIK